MNIKQDFRQNLKYGTWCTINNLMITEMISLSGADFLILDMEHGNYSLESLQSLLNSRVKSPNFTHFVRLPEINGSNILRVLEAGVRGLVFPNIESIEQVQDIVRHSYYPPIGKRGVSPWTPSARYDGNRWPERRQRRPDSRY